MKSILLITLFTIAFNPAAKAGFYDSHYFEPSIAFIVVGGLRYTSSKDIKKAATSGAIAALVTSVITMHFQNKYGEEFEPQKELYRNKLRNYKKLDAQNKAKRSNPHFSRQIEVIEPQVLQNGQGIGRRIRQKMILNDASDRLGY